MPKGQVALPLGVLASRWQIVRREARRNTERERHLNQVLSERVDAEGEPDDKGHVWLELGEE